MKYLSAREVEAKLFRLVREVAQGETIIITDNETGEPIARLEPIDESSEVSNE